MVKVGYFLKINHYGTFFTIRFSRINRRSRLSFYL